MDKTVEIQGLVLLTQQKVNVIFKSFLRKEGVQENDYLYERTLSLISH